jgi:TolB protein
MAEETPSSGRGALARRRFVCIGAAAGMATFACEPAYAILFRHPVERSNVRIALPYFIADAPAVAELARLIPEIIGTNLERTGRFVLIDQAVFPETPNIDAWPRFPDWRATKAAALVIGRVTRQPDGRIKVEFRLWDVSGDVPGAAQLIARQYLSTPDKYPRIANIISDDVYDALLGEPGHFDASASP